MKAKMRDRLEERYKELLPKEYDEETGKFLRSIEGKEVELRFVGNDAFEVKDDSIWLPDSLWDEVPENALANASADLPAVAGKVRRDVGQESKGGDK